MVSTLPWRQSLVVVAADASAGAGMVAVEELENPIHAPNLLMQIWVFIR